MTERERRALREALDAARREQVAAELATRCARCETPLEPRPRKRFCSTRCRTYAWYHGTERGRQAFLRRRVGVA